MSQQQILEMIDTRIVDFQKQVTDPRFQEVMNAQQALEGKLTEMQGAFVEVKDNFEAIEVQQVSRISEMEKMIAGKLDEADSQIKSFQTQLTADMGKASDLFKKTDELMIQMRVDVDAARADVKSADYMHGQETQQMETSCCISRIKSKMPSN